MRPSIETTTYPINTTQHDDEDSATEIENLFDSELSLNQIIEALRDTETTTMNYFGSEQEETTTFDGNSLEVMTLNTFSKESNDNQFKIGSANRVSYIPQTTFSASSEWTSATTAKSEASTEYETAGMQHKESPDMMIDMDHKAIGNNGDVQNTMNNILRESFDNVLLQVQGNDSQSVESTENNVETTTIPFTTEAETEANLVRISSPAATDVTEGNDSTKYLEKIVSEFAENKKTSASKPIATEKIATTTNVAETTHTGSAMTTAAFETTLSTLANLLNEFTTKMQSEDSTIAAADFETTEKFETSTEEEDSRWTTLQTATSESDSSETTTSAESTETTSLFADDNGVQTTQTERLLREDSETTTAFESFEPNTDAPTAYQLVKLIENVSKKPAAESAEKDKTSTIASNSIERKENSQEVDQLTEIPVGHNEDEFLRLGETTTIQSQKRTTTEKLLEAVATISKNKIEEELKIHDVRTPVDSTAHPVVSGNEMTSEKPQKTSAPTKSANIPKKSNKIRLDPAPKQALGLEESTLNADGDVLEFTKFCNELAFSFWRALNTEGISMARGLIVSPFALISMLAMTFLGARGRTAGEINDLLHLDDIVTFNPHAIFKNITDSVEDRDVPNILTGGFIRELFSDRSKGKILAFYKEKALQFYSGYVEEINFNAVNDIIRRRTNLLVKRHTDGRIADYLTTNNIWARSPLVGVSANIFETDCSVASKDERDGEMFFQVLPAVRHRRLVPIPAAVWKTGFTAGYDPELDATAVAIGLKDNVVSTIFVMPGQQGHSVPGDSLERLESVLMVSAVSKNAWRHLLATLMERHGLEVQIPRFTHRSFVNTTSALQKLGIKTLFAANEADLRGITGSTVPDLFVSDLVQINTFSMCGEDKLSKEQQHVEMYPAPPNKYRRMQHQIPSPAPQANVFDETQRAFYDPHFDLKYLNLPLPLRPRQARIPETPRLRFDKPFVYFVRHNPTGMILYMGRFNPRLLP